MPSTQARIKRVFREEGSDWYRIELEGSDIKRLDTKNREAAAEAARLKESGELALIDFTERESKNTNPHTNRPYIDRYYEKAGPISNGRGESGIETVSQTSRKTDPGDAWRITLAAAAKLAIATVGALPEAARTEKVVLDFELQQRIALAWAKFLYFSTPPDPSKTNLGDGGYVERARAAQETSRGAYDEPPPPTDDDIPY